MSVVIAALAVAWIRDDGTRITGPRDGSSSAGAGQLREDAAARLLGRLQSALTRGERADALALAAPGRPSARAEIGSLFDNVRELGLTDLSFRYVDLNSSFGDTRTFGVDVALAWRIGGFDDQPSRVEVPFVLAESPRGASFVSASPTDDAADGVDAGVTPLWLLGDLTVQRTPRALVMVTDESTLAEYSANATRAVADAKRVLTRWRGKLVVEVPGSDDDLERVVGAPEDTYRSIAAVTSTVDGSLTPSAPEHIFVNPTVFGQLSEDGAQIVMSHEAAHVATGAATSSTPMWLLEGFADYVALANADLPVSVTASQILATVRQDGPPRRLPAAGDFDPSRKSLGTSYEAAWLACRYIGERYGERRLVDLYQAVDQGTSLRAGFARFLDTDPRAFTRAWQGYLSRLAA